MDMLQDILLVELEKGIIQPETRIYVTLLVPTA